MTKDPSAVAAEEREKYVRMWARPEYRVWSPGLDAVPAAAAFFGAPAPVIDFGCGRGLAIDAFDELGFEAVGVDLIKMHRDVVEAPLWNLPALLKPAPFGFCVDVLEHVPPELVDAAIAAIASKVERAAYIQVSTRPDSCGKLIGEVLHLTVRPAPWWLEKVSDHFNVLSLSDANCVCVLRCAANIPEEEP